MTDGIIEENVIISMKMVQEFFFEDSEDEMDHVLPKVAEVAEFAEETVPRFNDRQFKMHFRINPDTFENLLQKLHHVRVAVNERAISRGHPLIPMEKEIMITIWCLSNLESFRTVADRFGISKSTCWDVLYRTCKNLLIMNSENKIISWPNRIHARQISDRFEIMNGFPGIIGVIDGCHIRILKPKNNPNSYCNRKNFHSVLLQGVCDDKMLFLDVYAGEAGSMHDWRLFTKSDLYRRINDGPAEIPNDMHIIGDLAYKLSSKMLVGFKDIAGLSIHQKNYNLKLSQCLIVIEHAFAYLKGRFRRLKSLETIRHDLIALLIISGCILHNICILRGDSPEDIVGRHEIEESLLFYFMHYNEIAGNIDLPNDMAGINKRDFIMRSLVVDVRFIE